MFAKHTRAVLLEVHTWTGLVVGFVLYTMLVFGAVALYREELGRWEDPAQHVAGRSVSDAAALRALERTLPAGVNQLYVQRPSSSAPVHIVWHPVPGRETWKSVIVDGARGTVRDSDVHASRTLFNLHFLYHESATFLYYVSGLVAVAFLLAIVTGTLFHLKQLGPQLGRFRPETAPRVATTDLHKVLGVIGLPFQLVFAITGSLIVFGPVLIDTYVHPVLGVRPPPGATPEEAHEHEHELLDALMWGEAQPIATPIPVAGGVDERIAFAERRHPGLAIESFSISGRGTPDETFEVEGRDTTHFAAYTALEFRGPEMPLVAEKRFRDERASNAVTRWVFGLHYARFGGALLRVVYALLALAAAATALSGTLVWISRKGPATHRIMRAATEATGTGTFLAAGAMLLASRWLPRPMDSRATVEEAILFGTFLLVQIDSVFARDAWAALERHLVAVGAVFLLFPIATASIGSRGLLAFVAGAGSSGASVVGGDLFGVVFAIVAFAAAWYVRRRRRPASPLLSTASEASHA